MPTRRRDKQAASRNEQAENLPRQGNAARGSPRRAFAEGSTSRNGGSCRQLVVIDGSAAAAVRPIALARDEARLSAPLPPRWLSQFHREYVD
jgi:hypothetical protein